MRRSADISDDGLYRWSLRRKWGDGDDVVWVMLNPSTADGEKDDPTLTRIMRFSDGWGYGGLMVVNLIPFRSSKPAEAKQWYEENNTDLSGVSYELSHNMQLVGNACRRAALTVAAWGAAEWVQDWAKDVIAEYQLGDVLHCIGENRNGSPKHPLYMPADVRPRPLSPSRR